MKHRGYEISEADGALRPGGIGHYTGLKITINGRIMAYTEHNFALAKRVIDEKVNRGQWPQNGNGRSDGGDGSTGSGPATPAT